MTKDQTAASFNALYWYGNTSSGSLWYELSYIEACQKVKKGDTVWMVRLVADPPPPAPLDGHSDTPRTD